MAWEEKCISSTICVRVRGGMAGDVRVMGKGRPESVRPYMEILQLLAESDPNPVVRIHSAGAIRITSEETTARRG